MKEKLYPLNFLRILSAFFVFLFHSNAHMGNTYSFLTPFISIGAVFMSAFFLLSGFTLFYNYGSENIIELSKMKSFYIKRIFNIYPLYLFVLMYFFLIENNLSPFQNIIIMPMELLLLQSFFSGASGILGNGGTWFISCIFICYLLFPFLNSILQQKNLSKKIITPILYIICSLSPFTVYIFGFGGIYGNPFFRLLEFFIGMIVASFLLDNNKKKNKYMPLYVIIDLILLVFLTTLLIKNNSILNYTNLGFIVIPIFSLIIYHLAKLNNKYVIAFLKISLLQYLNTISYAFFISQLFVWDIVRYLKFHFNSINSFQNTESILLSFFICLLISIILHELIEKPVVKIYTRFFKKKSLS